MYFLPKKGQRENLKKKRRILRECQKNYRENTGRCDSRNIWKEDQDENDKIIEVVLGDNEVYITVSGSDKFRYVIKNSQEEVLYTIEKGLGVTEIVLPMPSALWELYSVTALTEEGVIVKKSNPLAILTW